MRFITPGWAAVVIAAIALFVGARMLRYEYIPGGAWDRWNHVLCFVGTPGMSDSALTCKDPSGY